jgi:hypothetical protein
MSCNYCWSFKHASNKYCVQELAIFHQDSPDSSALQLEASILMDFNVIPPDKFRAELCDSRTTVIFYENILKKSSPKRSPGDVLLPSPCPAISSPRLHSCFNHPTTQTQTPSIPLPTQPPGLLPLHRHRTLRWKPRAPRKVAAADAGTPPSKKGGGGNKTCGRARSLD